jgi:UDP-N-acetyl-D-mannosaminuronic acid dehydrogenase
MSDTRLNRLAVIGLGYVGLPTAAVFASRRVTVIGVDVNECTVATINSGNVHIDEPELDMLVRAAVGAGMLRATTVPEPADAFLIAVPTPFKGEHQPDLDHVRAAAQSIAPVLAPGNIVILESTSPVGTTEQLAHWLSAARPDLCFPGPGAEGVVDVHIAYCPERVLPGHVIRELVENDRIIGGLTPACSRRAEEVYRTCVAGAMHITDARTAEMSKLAENAYRDVNVAFANELSMICDRLGIPVWDMIALANHHPRVKILQPSCGVGGHCVAVDPWFIVDAAPKDSRLIRTAREVNDAKPRWVHDQIRRAVTALVAEGREESSVVVALLGLAFKPNVADLRESPALQVAHALSTQTTARLLAVEPNVTELPAGLGRVEWAEHGPALEQADIVAVLVGHQEFRDLPRHLLQGKRVIDVTGVLAASGRP